MERKIYSFFLIIFIAVAFLTNCKRDTTPIRILYTVSFKTDDTCEVLVRYKDSVDYVTLSVTKNWSKEIYLPPNTVASLVAIPRKDFSIDAEDPFSSFEKWQREAIIEIEIVRDWCTMSSKGKDALSLSVITSNTCEEEEP